MLIARRQLPGVEWQTHTHGSLRFVSAPVAQAAFRIAPPAPHGAGQPACTPKAPAFSELDGGVERARGSVRLSASDAPVGIDDAGLFPVAGRLGRWPNAFELAATLRGRAVRRANPIPAFQHRTPPRLDPPHRHGVSRECRRHQWSRRVDRRDGRRGDPSAGVYRARVTARRGNEERRKQKTDGGPTVRPLPNLT
jgi:hypothetical protein